MGSTTIILVNYNNSTDTIECLKSIAAQDRPVDIVIIDNHSKSTAIQQLENYIGRNHPKITLLKNNRNVGFGNAINTAFDHIQRKGVHDFVFVLNNDTRIYPGVIRTLEEALTADDTAAIAVPRIVLLENPSTIWYAGGEINWYKGLPKIQGYGKSIDTIVDLQPRPVTFATGCAMLIRSNVFFQLGGFNKEFFMYAEDMEFSIRCTIAGWNIMYIPDATIGHKGQASIRQSTGPFVPILHPDNPNLAFYVYHIVKNTLLTMSLHARGINKIKFGFGFPVFWLYKNLRFIVKGKMGASGAFIRGCKDFLHLKFKNAIKNRIITWVRVE